MGDAGMIMKIERRLAPDGDRVEDAHSRYEQELNAFAAHLSKHDLAVAKFICEIVLMDDEANPERTYRTMLWLATSLEL